MNCGCKPDSVFDKPARKWCHVSLDTGFSPLNPWMGVLVFVVILVLAASGLGIKYFFRKYQQVPTSE
jgi:hypothetical protein